jgi:hypothetical protein
MENYPPLRDRLNAACGLYERSKDAYSSRGDDRSAHAVVFYARQCSLAVDDIAAFVAQYLPVFNDE